MLQTNVAYGIIYEGIVNFKASLSEPGECVSLFLRNGHFKFFSLIWSVHFAT